MSGKVPQANDKFEIHIATYLWYVMDFHTASYLQLTTQLSPWSIHSRKISVPKIYKILFFMYIPILPRLKNSVHVHGTQKLHVSNSQS